MNLKMIDPYLRSASTFLWDYMDTEPSVSYDMRMFAVSDGEAKLYLGDEMTLMKAGSVLLTGAGMPYLFRNLDEEKPFTLYCISYDITQEFRDTAVWIPPTHLSSFHPEYIIDKRPFASQGFGFPILLHGAGEITELIIQIYGEWMKNDSFSIDLASGLIKTALITALRSRGDESGEMKREPLSLQNARSAVRYMESRFREDISETSIAREFSFHPYYLARIIKRWYGVTPYRYILELRLREARRLLEETSLTVGEIGRICGFSSQQAFAAALKRETGMTALGFRKPRTDIKTAEP